MHTLDDVSTIVEDSPNVLCVDRASEMWVTIVTVIIAACANSLKNKIQLLLFCLSKVVLE